MGAYKINIGDANHYLKWTGSKLEIKGDILAGTISGTRFNVGGGVGEDIYFKDSGIRLSDAGNAYLYFTKPYYSSFYIHLSLDHTYIYSFGQMHLKGATSPLNLMAGGRSLNFYDTGELAFPLLTSAPAGAKGRFAYNSTNDRPAFHNVGAWRHWIGLASW